MLKENTERRRLLSARWKKELRTNIHTLAQSETLVFVAELMDLMHVSSLLLMPDVSQSFSAAVHAEGTILTAS